MTDMGEEFANNVKVPEGFVPRSETLRGRIDSMLSQANKYRTAPGYSRERRIAYGVGGGAAALATVLGLSNMGKEEEEQRNGVF